VTLPAANATAGIALRNWEEYSKYINAVQNKVEKDIWQTDQGIAFGNWHYLFNLGD
jgi:hypothetical protein